MQPPDPKPLPGRAASLIAAIACASLTGCAFGLSLPLLSLNLEAMTGSGAVVGLVALMGSVSTLFAAPFVPALMTRAPGRLLLGLSCAFSAACFLLFRVSESVLVWALLRFAFGFAITIVFVVSEAWINQLAGDRHRGALIGAYAAALAAGLGLGGIIIGVLGVEGVAPFLAGAIVFASGALVVALPGPGVEAPEAGSAGPRAVLAAAPKAPAVFLGILAFGAIETAALNFISVYGVRTGMAEQPAALLLTAAGLGNLVLQFPLGWLGDRLGARRVMLGCAAAGAVGPLAIWASLGIPGAIYPVVFLYAGAVTGMYTLSLVLLGQGFAARQLPAANALFVFCYGVGSTISPPPAGWAMDALDPHGLMLALAALPLAYLAFAALRWRRRI